MGRMKTLNPKPFVGTFWYFFRHSWVNHPDNPMSLISPFSAISAIKRTYANKWPLLLSSVLLLLVFVNQSFTWSIIYLLHCPSFRTRSKSCQIEIKKNKLLVNNFLLCLIPLNFPHMSPMIPHRFLQSLVFFFLSKDFVSL